MTPITPEQLNSKRNILIKAVNDLLTIHYEENKPTVIYVDELRKLVIDANPEQVVHVYNGANWKVKYYNESAGENYRSYITFSKKEK